MRYWTQGASLPAARKVGSTISGQQAIRNYSNTPSAIKSRNLRGRRLQQLIQAFSGQAVRKSNRYSKSKDMLNYSVMLLMLKRNENLNAIFDQQCL
jgi:hypothetical protein